MASPMAIYTCYSQTNHVDMSLSEDIEDIFTSIKGTVRLKRIRNARVWNKCAKLNILRAS